MQARSNDTPGSGATDERMLLRAERPSHRPDADPRPPAGAEGIAEIKSH